MKHYCRLFMFGLPLFFWQPAAMANNEAAIGQQRWVFALLAHDRGLLSDRHENGIDLNVERQFAPLQGAVWERFGSPRPHLGVSYNLQGYTSALYGGLSFETDPGGRYFAAAFLGLAIHDGPLHKEPLPCARDSDCGFGSRVIPRLGFELGLNLGRHQAVTLFSDHMSQGGLLNSENEGVDQTGIRYLHRF